MAEGSHGVNPTRLGIRCRGKRGDGAVQNEGTSDLPFAQFTTAANDLSRQKMQDPEGRHSSRAPEPARHRQEGWRCGEGLGSSHTRRRLVDSLPGGQRLASPSHTRTAGTVGPCQGRAAPERHCGAVALVVPKQRPRRTGARGGRRQSGEQREDKGGGREQGQHGPGGGRGPAGKSKPVSLSGAIGFRQTAQGNSQIEGLKVTMGEGGAEGRAEGCLPHHRGIDLRSGRLCKVSKEELKLPLR